MTKINSESFHQISYARKGNPRRILCIAPNKSRKCCLRPLSKNAASGTERTTFEEKKMLVDFGILSSMDLPWNKQNEMGTETLKKPLKKLLTKTFLNRSKSYFCRKSVFLIEKNRYKIRQWYFESQTFVMQRAKPEKNVFTGKPSELKNGCAGPSQKGSSCLLWMKMSLKISKNNTVFF